MKRFLNFSSFNACDDLHVNLLLSFPLVGEQTCVEEGEGLCKAVGALDGGHSSLDHM